MPCQSTVNYEDVYAETLANILNVTLNLNNCSFLIAGDFNCDMNVSHSMFSTIDEFMVSLGLVNVAVVLPNDIQYTFYQLTTGASSFIDHFIVSKDMVKAIQSYSTIDTGNNLSDHIPLSLHLTWSLQAGHTYAPSTAQPKPMKLRWDKADLNEYYFITSKFLSNVNIASAYNSVVDIEKCYCDIVNCLTRAASLTVPQKKSDFFKFWWDEELDQLKGFSIDTHQIWKDAGRPQTGPVYEAKRLSQANYKLAINRKRQMAQEDFTDALHEALMKKDCASFWKTWRAKFGRLKPPSVVGGSCNEDVIASKFADAFEAVSAPNPSLVNTDSEAMFNDLFRQYQKTESINSSACVITVDDVYSCISTLKRGKASGFDSLSNEHIMFSHPILVNLLMHLFNAMILFGYVPDAFGVGVIIPLIKNNDADSGNIDNYRGITLSSCISKLFELCLLLHLKSYLKTSDLQFGFKEDLGCIHALYTVRAVLDYFNKNGSTVTLCALDVSKAFDKVDHHVLFTKLVDRKVPVCLLNVLISWYSKCHAIVRWGGSVSRSFAVKAGVRQGGVLSPYFFAVYIDDLIRALEHSGHGCVIHGVYLGCIVYADDIF